MSAVALELLKAVRAGCSADTKKLLNCSESDEDVNVRDLVGSTPLMLAAENSDVAVMRLLLDRNADASAADDRGWTALHIAAYHDCVKAMELLPQDKEFLDAQNENGYSALVVASECGHNEAVAWLLSHNAEVNVRSQAGCTALMAACRNGHAAVVDELLCRGAQLEIHNNEDNTALLLACEGGHVQVVQKLLSGGASIHAQNMNRSTALVLAVQNGHIEVVHVHMHFMPTIPTLARSTIRPKASTATIYSEAKTDVNTPDKDGMTAAMWAAKEGHVDILLKLFSVPALVVDVHRQDHAGLSALMWAARGGHVDCVQQILSDDTVDVNLADERGFTALMWASRGGYIGTVERLVAFSADVNVVDKSGKSALDHATAKVVRDYLTAVLTPIPPAEDVWDRVVQRAQVFGEDVVTYVNRRTGEVSSSNPAPSASSASVPNVPVAPVAEDAWDKVVHRALLFGEDTVTYVNRRTGAVSSTKPAPSSASSMPTAAVTATGDSHSPPPSPMENARFSFTRSSSIGSPRPPISVDYAAGPSPAQDLLLENEFHRLFFHASSVTAYVLWKRRSEALPGTLEQARAERNFDEIAALKRQQARLQLDARHLTPHEDCETYIARLLALDKGLKNKCEALTSAQDVDVDALEVWADRKKRTHDLLDTINPRPLSMRHKVHTAAAPVSPPPAFPAGACLPFHSRDALIYNVAPLFQTGGPLNKPCRRDIFIGQFKGPDGPIGAPTVYRSVIKCILDTASPKGILQSFQALRKEHEVYARLQPSDAHTPTSVTQNFSGDSQDPARADEHRSSGCIQCFSYHPLYLVLEAHGKDLRSLLHPGLSNPQVVVEGIIRSVQCLHAHNIMHGDIKPQNILCQFNEYGECLVKLCDLEAAHPIGAVANAADLGTDFYRPPEVYLAEENASIKATPEIDLFSLGLVLWQVLERRMQPALPAVTDDPQLLHQCYTNQAMLHAQLVLSGDTEWYRPALLKITALHPNDRQGACNDFLDVGKLKKTFLQKSVMEKLIELSVQLEAVTQKVDHVAAVVKSGVICD